MNKCIFCKSISIKVVRKVIPKTKGQDFNFYVRCYSCSARGPLSKTESEAISKWNGEPIEKSIKSEKGLFDE